MKCKVCELIQKKKRMVYEDDKIMALLAPKPCAVGHIWIVPKKHAPILEQIPDFVVANMFSKANKLSMICFENLGVQGTNILIQNGVAAGQSNDHCILHVIPRQENDGMNLLWKPKQLNEEEMSTLELKIKEEAKNVGIFEKEQEKPIEEKKPEEVEDDSEDYMIKQLERIP